MRDNSCCLEVWGDCCCTCLWHYVDRSHPITDGKLMSDTRGYICAEPFLGYHSGWPEHGMCECWEQRPKRPEEVLGDEGTHYSLEAYDACYEKRDGYPMWRRLNKV